MRLIQAPTREHRTWTTDSRNWSRYRPRAGDIVIATYREDALGESFSMFDFAPVGLACAAVGVAYVALLGWQPRETFETGMRRTGLEPEELTRAAGSIPNTRSVYTIAGTSNEQGGTAGELRENIETARSGCQRIKEIVGGLSTFSRVERDRPDLFEEAGQVARGHDVRAGLLQGSRLGNHSLDSPLLPALHLESAEFVHGLGRQADMRADRNVVVGEVFDDFELGLGGQGGGIHQPAGHRAVGGAATTSGHRSRPRHGAAGHALRRADVGARSRTRRRAGDRAGWRGPWWPCRR